MMTNINSLYSQFYDVKIVKKTKVVGTRGEPNPLFTKNVSQPSEKSHKRFKKMDGFVLKEIVSEGEVKESADGVAHVRAEMKFCSPLNTLIVSSPYGYRKDPFTGKRKFHAGTDYVTATENVYAMMPGRIRKIGYDKRLGNFITIDHGDFHVTYAHLHTVVGDKGDIVRAGQSVGISGSTGRSTGEHLHVSMRYKKDVVDPDLFIRAVQNFSQLLYKTK